MPKQKHTAAWHKRHSPIKHTRTYNRAFMRHTLRLAKGEYMTNGTTRQR